MITYKTGKELIPAMNTVESVIETEEKDSSGGIRKVSQTDINSQPVSMNTSDGTQPLITERYTRSFRCNCNCRRCRRHTCKNGITKSRSDGVRCQCKSSRDFCDGKKS